MTAAITLDRSVAPAGTSVHVGVTGTGFAASGTVTVTVNGVAVAFDSGGVLSASGAFSDSVNIVTGNKVGAEVVSVTDGTSTATATVTTSVWQTAAIREMQESTSKTAYSTP